MKLKLNIQNRITTAWHKCPNDLYAFSIDESKQLVRCKSILKTSQYLRCIVKLHKNSRNFTSSYLT